MTDQTHTPRTDTLLTSGAEDLPIIERVRRGRLAALAALRARTAASGNVVSIFETAIPTRAAEPMFHSCRRPAPLLLTNPIAA